MELTGPEGGESLTRHEARPGEIVVADRGHCHRRGAGRLLSKEGGLVLRISLQNIPLADEKGKPMDVLAWLRGASTEAVERAVLMASPEGTFRLRLVARRLSEDGAEKARCKLRQAARKKGRTPDKRSLEAASFITVLTNLDENDWSPREILALYRLCWQVEMAIERLKGVLSIDHLRAEDKELCQTYLLVKLLGALLIDRLSGIEGSLEADWALCPERPVSPWRHLVLSSRTVERSRQEDSPGRARPLQPDHQAGQTAPLSMRCPQEA